MILIEIFVGASARSAYRLVERAECFSHARLGTLFERIVKSFVWTDKDSGKQRKTAVRNATWIGWMKNDRTAVILCQQAAAEVHFPFLCEGCREYVSRRVFFANRRAENLLFWQIAELMFVL